MHKFTFPALIAFLLVACGATQPATEPQPLASPAFQWTSVKMTHSGGIMGLMRTIEISSDGAWTVTDERSQKTVTGQLSSTQLTDLSALISALPKAPPSKPGTNCADCFIYTLEITTSGKPLRMEADDISLPDSGLEPLVTFLRGLMDDALK